MERLRYVARASGVGHDVIAKEFANSLGPVADNHPELVTVCRRILARHPMSGPLWWLCSRILTSADPYREAWEAADELEADRTARALSHALPDGAQVCILGWPEVISRALPSRGDVVPLVIDTLGEGSGLVRRLARSDIDAVDVSMTGLGAAASTCDVVLLEASAIGPTEAVAVAGSRAAAAVASHAGVPVWLVGGVGRVLPQAIWDQVTDRMDGDLWHRDDEIVPLDLVEQIVDATGPRSVIDVVSNIDAAVAPELFNPGIAL